MMRQSYETYKQQLVMTMTQAEMLTMLYDGILKEIYIVRQAFLLEPKDLAIINKGLQKAQRILNYLIASLDTKYDVAIGLLSLYDYCGWVLTQANIKKDPEGLEDVEEIIAELKESYISADRNLRMTQRANA